MQLEGKSLKGDFARFVTPTVLSLAVFSLYSLVDGIFVARGVSETAMAAVNLAIPFINFLFSVAILFAVGTSTLIAINLGQGHREEADRLFSQNLVVVACLGVLISAVTLCFAGPLARLLGAADHTLEYVKTYLRGVAPFSACFIVSYLMEILVKTDGYPRLAIIAVTTGCTFHCLMDYILIFHFKVGIVGAAIATGSSQLLTCVIYFTHFLRGRTTFRLRKFRFDPHIYKRLLPIGVSDGVTELCTGLMIFLFNRTILRTIGEDGLVSYTIIAYVNTLVVMSLVGVSQGMQPLVSYHYGKGERRQCSRLLRYGLTTAAVMSAVIFTALYVFTPQVVAAFLARSSAQFGYSVKVFREYSFSFLLVGFNVVLGGFLTAVERPRAAITISVGRGLVVQSACLLTLAAVFGGGGIWYAALLSETLVLFISYYFFRQYKKSLA